MRAASPAVHGHRGLHIPEGPARVWTLNAAIALVALLVYALSVRTLEPIDSSVDIPWWTLAGLFCLAEMYVIHLQIRRDAHSFSLSEIPLVLGLFFTSPEGLMLAQLVGATIGLALYRRQSLLKLAFNVSHFCLEAAVAVVLFHGIVSFGNPTGPLGWTGAFVGTLVTTLIGVVMIDLAISLSEGSPGLRDLPRTLAPGVTITVANTSLALIGVVILMTEPRAAFLLLVPIAILFFSYRAYTAQRERHESLESLYGVTRELQQSLRVESALIALVSQCREMFRAEIAEILLFPANHSGNALRTTLGPGEQVELMLPEQIHPNEGVWARVASEHEALLFAHPIENERLRLYFERRNMTDAMVAPLTGKNGVFGTMLVGNRLGTVSTFDREDLHLFETLANHASVSLENARLVARLEESLAHLTEMNSLKDDFVASVSHELRTPLTSIQGYVKTMLRPDVEFLPEQRDLFLETINRQSERLRQLIEDLLVVARLESKREAPVVTTMSLRHLALQVVDELRSRGSSHTLHLRLGDDLPPIRTDSGKVHQIISNLVDNAIKYTPERTRVTISGRLSSSGIIVSVEDEGPGIDPDKQDRIFDRFYQVDQSSTRTVGGTGLGLYICRKLADSIGAQVWLERSDANGSVFSLSLPWALSEVPIDLTDKDVETEGSQGSFVIIEGGAVETG